MNQIGDKIRTRRRHGPKVHTHSVERDHVTAWQNSGWEFIGPDREKPGYALMRFIGPRPDEHIPYIFDLELATVLQARGDLDDREGVQYDSI